jgi:hypothetical protein
VALYSVENVYYSTLGNKLLVIKNIFDLVGGWIFQSYNTSTERGSATTSTVILKKLQL